MHARMRDQQEMVLLEAATHARPGDSRGRCTEWVGGWVGGAAAAPHSNQVGEGRTVKVQPPQLLQPRSEFRGSCKVVIGHLKEWRPRGQHADGFILLPPRSTCAARDDGCSSSSSSSCTSTGAALLLQVRLQEGLGCTDTFVICIRRAALVLCSGGQNAWQHVGVW